MAKPTIVICGPSPDAVGGGPTHMRNLEASPLASEFELVRFETGSRGKESPATDEPPLAMLWRLATSPFRLAAVLLRRRPALVHLNTSLTPKGFWREIAHLVVCRLLGARAVYQIHGGTLEALAPGGAMRSLARAVFGWPDAIVLLSSSERAQFERLGGVRRMVVIPNAVDTAAFRGRERVHSGTVKQLAYLGRLTEGKGDLESVEAVALLRGEDGFRDLRFDLAGSGPSRAALEERIARLGLADRVRLLGAIHGEEKVRFLREADVLLMPTRLTEGLPYTILEALAAGTPVLTTRRGGIPDVIVDHEYGVFVDPPEPAAIAAALRELAASPERLKAMSRACVGYAERELSLERLARQFAALYREVMAG